MTTEELARRFCELTKLDYREAEGVVYLRKRENEWTIPLEGWAGVGIVVDEMWRRGFHVSVDEVDSPRPSDMRRMFAATFGGANMRWDNTPIGAVLAAANAALEAEGAR